ncbi:PRC-barrel domain-containing protein [Limobrevibacterium gyesilva]|uniref:PRC-barrel domain-containing protein n=1 Tax=Limobrevibacterium gyesilva TaxID=2991712 RepID=A0AA41YHY6_9PROT|nr:PRC-barrel domain-containing protein [Limobrevibacterium gyesilva]
MPRHRVSIAVIAFLGLGASVVPGPAVRAQPPPPPVAAGDLVPPNEVVGLLGHVALSAAGKDLGRVVDVLVDTQGIVRAVVIDVGGFFGVGSRKVAFAWSALHFARGDKGPVVSVVIPSDRIKTWPDYQADKPIAILGADGTGR